VSICIIGGSSSLGQEITRQAEKQRETIIATYNKNIFSAKAELKHLNLLDTIQVNAFLPNNVHHLIFAQGLLFGKTIGEYEFQKIEESVVVNLTSTLQIINNLITNQCFTNPALITFVASIAALQGSYDVVYASSKAGQIGCAKSIAKHHSPKLRANVVCPGLIKDSGMYYSMTIDDRTRHLEQTPTKQLTTIEHLAELILKLNDSYYSNLNGAVINLNGGRFV